MDLDELVAHGTGGESASPLLSAIVASEPNADGMVDVVIPSFSRDLRHGPCPVMPHGGSRPRRGDACLVGLDDEGKPWVLAWHGPDALAPGGEFAVDTRGGMDVTFFFGVDADGVPYYDPDGVPLDEAARVQIETDTETGERSVVFVVE